jgi:hypothetical protein
VIAIGAEAAMGVFRIVHAEMPCRRCGFVREVGVQFKTDAGDWMQGYRVGDVVDDVAPDVYGGITDAYCTRCKASWIEDDKRISFDVIAEQVAAGESVARRGSWCYAPAEGQLVVTLEAAPPLGADDIRALADAPAGPGVPSVLTHLEGVVLWQGDLRIHPHLNGQDSTGWWLAFGAEVERRMHVRGWPEGRWDTIDLDVVVDADHRLSLAPASED